MSTEVAVVDVEGLDALVDVLRRRGFAVHGPVCRDGSFVAEPMRTADRLPIGWTMHHEPGASQLRRRGDRLRFGWSVGAQAWKPLLLPPRQRTIELERSAHDDGRDVAVSVRRVEPDGPPLALFGVRPCELAAIGALDRVLLDRPETPDPAYRARRAGAFVVVVNCGAPAPTCFCTSFATGPHVAADEARHDLQLTELRPDDPAADPRYLIRGRGDEGLDVLAELCEAVAARAPSDADVAAATTQRDGAAAMIERHVDAGVADTIVAAHDDPRWDVVADRCLACGNCTAVCPTCFCTSLEDVTDLADTRVDRWRTWDSCFGLEFSRLGSTTVRTSVRARYRQWLTHKLGTWHDQFGEAGCVGCGRCITWCPVGIDLTDEASALAPSRKELR